MFLTSRFPKSFIHTAVNVMNILMYGGAIASNDTRVEKNS